MLRLSIPSLVLLFLAGCRPELGREASEELLPGAEEASSSQKIQSETTSKVEPEVIGQPSLTEALEGQPTENAEAAKSPQKEPATGNDDERTGAVAGDLATELSIAVGSLRDCMQDIAIVRSSIDVSATALVLPTGTVTQASVTGVGLSQRERSCIANRVSAVVLGPLESERSTRVSTRILVDLSAPAPVVRGYQVGPKDPALRNVRDPLPKRPEVAPSGRPIQEPTSRPIQEPTSRPIQEPKSRRVRGPQPRPIDGWDVDQSSKDWR